VWFYFGKLVWPVNLLFIYPQWHIDARSLWSYAPGVALVVILAVAWWRRHTWGRPVVMLLICYVGLLGPALGFVNIYFMRFSRVADHYQYAAMVVACAVFAGLAAALAGGGAESGRRRGAALAGKRARQLPKSRGPRVPRFVLVPLGLGLLTMLAVLTFRQSQIYANVETLYRAVIAGNPDCWLAYGNLGQALADEGRTDEAIDCYQKALRIYPDCVESRHNLGYALAHLGHFDEAIAEYRRALEAKPGVATCVALYDKLGASLLALGRVDEAIAAYRQALVIQPSFVPGHNSLGAALASRGRLDEAMAEYRAALEIDPKAAGIHYNLGDALAAQGRLDEAIVQFETALQIDPKLSAARQKADRALFQRDQILKMMADWRQALRAHPNDAVLLNSLARLLVTSPNASIRNGPEAVGLARRAVQVSGGQHPGLLTTLAAAYAESGQFAEAASTAQKALELATQQDNSELMELLRRAIPAYQARAASPTLPATAGPVPAGR
jgi:tetratricopeptide (TPR) repeat protein